jgi:chemotaxis protein CheX
MTDHLTLPNRLDSSAAPTLTEAILARRGKALVLDAAGVDVIGALCLEVIVAAGRQWEADGIDIRLAEPSDRFAGTAAMLGLRADAPWQAEADTP